MNNIANIANIADHQSNTHSGSMERVLGICRLLGDTDMTLRSLLQGRSTLQKNPTR
jgi:hypothetical protein